MANYLLIILLVTLVDGGFADKMMMLSVNEGDSVFLNTGVIKQHHDKMLWYFNDTLIALINGEVNTSCLYDGEDGRFRGRVKVDYKTGSLIITNITSEHAGRYEANFIQSKSSGTSTSLKRNSKCDSTKITRKTSNIGDTIKTFIVSLSPSPSVHAKIVEESNEEENCVSSSVYVAVISAVAVLMSVAVAVGLIYYRRRRFTNEGEKNKLEHLLKVSI